MTRVLLTMSGFLVRSWMWILWLGLTWAPLVSAQIQAFRTEPSDLEVILGSTAILRCEIDNRRGDLQWFQGEFGLGYSRDIPGYARYRVIGNEERGEYNLLINGVQLEDDGVYHCQVLPLGDSPALMASAQLKVLMPPDLPVIEGYTNGSTVKVPHQQDQVNLTCLSTSGKPAAELSWFRNGEAVEEGFEYSASESSEHAKLMNAMSVLTLEPRKEDNGAFFQCQATNGALRQPLATMIMLSVMHPPNPPEIEGFTPNKIIKTGDTMKLMCISKGGNPLARVYWYRNDIELDFSYESGDDQAENELIFTVEPSDNEAVYRCEASNLVTPEPLKKEIKLKVLFAPEVVTISGHQFAKAGETVTLKCESSISNPAAVLTWFTGRDKLEGATSETNPSDEGGFVTSSEISVTLTGQQNDAIYECRATNDELGVTVIETINLKVLYPPEQPTISGYTEGRPVAAGAVQALTCTAVGGNPLAKLTWYKGTDELEGITRTTGNIVSSQLTFILKPDDNGASYCCNASNEATIEPLSTTASLNVNFPPKSLEITTDPENPKAGEQLTLQCKSSTSNPTSVLSWWKDGEEIQGIDGGTVDAEYFGKSTINKLQLIPTVDDDGEIYSCRATNPLLERSVNDAVVLNVLYEPSFGAEVPTTIDIVEHQSLSVNFTAGGNPSEIEYTWKKMNGEDVSSTHFTVSGGVLNIVNITRTQGGEYQCTATNTEGSTVLNVTINVQYPAGIVSITKEVMVTQGDNATLECVVVANPMPVNLMKIQRAGYSMDDVVTFYKDGTMRLTIVNVQKEDLGVFTCLASNGVGEEASAEAALVVKFPPVIDQDAAYGKAAADAGNTAKLLCKADGAPGVTFAWLKGTEQLDVSGLDFKEETKKTGLVRYESELVVYNVTKDDYGQYKCVASNDLGVDSRLVSLHGTSRPDPPHELQFINATHNSITLAWKPGFNGGISQKFQIRYRETGEEEGYRYEDVVPSGASIYTIKELKLATEYIMTVRGINSLGSSAFQDQEIKTRTSAVAPQSSSGPKDNVTLIIILTVSIIGMILLALNVMLILFFIRKRRRRKEKEMSEGASQANTLEMLSARTVTEDSKSYSGYDGRSLEEYPEYGHYDDDDEMRKFLGQPPPMFPPPYYSNEMMFAPPNNYPPGYYPPPMAASPMMDGQRGYPMGKGSREPLYLDDKMAPPAWDPLSMGQPPHQGQMMSDPHDDYTDQLRRMQQNVPGPARPSSSSGNLGPPDVRSRDPTPQGPPAPPTRSSSKGAVDSAKNMPPLPARNYAPEDVPRYGPPPGSSHPASPTRGSGNLPPPDVRGHLV